MKSKNTFEQLKHRLKFLYLDVRLMVQVKQVKQISELLVHEEKVFYFRHGEIIRKVPEETMVEELKKEIDQLAKEYEEKQQL